jgi:hypothetical protein
VLAMDFRHCQILDPVGSAVAFPKSIEFWKDRRTSDKRFDRRTSSIITTGASADYVSNPQHARASSEAPAMIRP